MRREITGIDNQELIGDRRREQERREIKELGINRGFHLDALRA